MTASPTITATVVEFADAVRAALSDLPPDDVDELTDGLEADLAEEAEEQGREGADFGDPDAYAEELRAAAGLSPRGDGRPARRSIQDWAADSAANFRDNVEANPGLRRVVELLVALRPVWWVLRGWAVYQLLGGAFGSIAGFHAIPTSGPRWLALLVAVLISVQWGRGRWLPTRWLRWLKVAVSVIAAATLAVLIPTAASAAAAESAPLYVEPASPSTSGLARDGEPVSNVFAYDSAGEPLTGVQLFDQDGRPLDLVGDDQLETAWSEFYDDNGLERIVVPSREVPGRAGWNVFPLGTVDYDDIDWDSGDAGEVDPSDVSEPRSPFERVQPLTGADPVTPSAGSPAEGAAEVDATPTPDASSAPTPSPSPSAP